MKNQTLSMSEFFGDAIYTYTREQAISDGVLVDVSSVAREAGFKIPVAMTSNVWNECVAWTGEDNKKQTYQDESGRLWDVLSMAMLSARNHQNSSQVEFSLYCIPRDGKRRFPKLITLNLQIGAGDDYEPVMTILFPGED